MMSHYQTSYRKFNRLNSRSSSMHSYSSPLDRRAYETYHTTTAKVSTGSTKPTVPNGLHGNRSRQSSLRLSSSFEHGEKSKSKDRARETEKRKSSDAEEQNKRTLKKAVKVS